MDFLNYCRRLSGDDTTLNNTLGTTGAEVGMVSKYNDLDEPVFDREDLQPPVQSRPTILEDCGPPKGVRKNFRYHKHPRVTRQQSSGPLSAWLQIEKESHQP